MADARRRSVPSPSSPPAAGPSCSAGRFYGYWLFALAAVVAAFASHIYVRHRVVSLGYELGRERTQRAQLENDLRDLELELAALAAPADLAQVARDVLGLDAPRDDQLLELDPARLDGESDPAAATVPVPAGPTAEGGAVGEPERSGRESAGAPEGHGPASGEAVP